MMDGRIVTVDAPIEFRFAYLVAGQVRDAVSRILRMNERTPRLCGDAS